MYNGAIIINQIIVLSGSLISGKTYSRILQIAERVFCSICQVEIGFLRIIIDFQESYSWLISYVRSKKLQIFLSAAAITNARIIYSILSLS